MTYQKLRHYRPCLPGRIFVAGGTGCMFDRASVLTKHIEIYHLLIKNDITNFSIKISRMKSANSPIIQRQHSVILWCENFISIHPQISVETSVLNRFAKMLGPNLFAFAEIGNCPGNFQYAVVCPRRESELCHRHLQ